MKTTKNDNNNQSEDAESNSSFIFHSNFKNDTFIVFFYRLRQFYFKYSFLYILTKYFLGILFFIVPIIITVVLIYHNKTQYLFLPFFLSIDFLILYMFFLIFIKIHRSSKNLGYNFPPWDRKNLSEITENIGLLLFLFFFIKRIIYCIFQFNLKYDSIEEHVSTQTKFEEYIYYFFSYDGNSKLLFRLKYKIVFFPLFIYTLYFSLINLLFDKKNWPFSFIISLAIFTEYFSLYSKGLSSNFAISFFPFLLFSVGIEGICFRKVYKHLTKEKEKKTICLNIITIISTITVFTGMSLFQVSYILYTFTHDDKQSLTIFIIGALILTLGFVYFIGDELVRVTFTPIEKECFKQYEHIPHAILLEVKNVFIIQHYYNFRPKYDESIGISLDGDNSGNQGNNEISENDNDQDNETDKLIVK